MTIRNARLDDAAELAGVITELGYSTTAEEMKERLQQLNSTAGYRTFVAEVDEVVVGMAGTCKGVYYEYAGEYVRLVAMVVSAQTRRKGIGKSLINAVEDWATSIGAGAIVLNCGSRPERRVGHEFYKKCNYIPKSIGYTKNLK